MKASTKRFRGSEPFYATSFYATRVRVFCTLASKKREHMPDTHLCEQKGFLLFLN